MRRWLIAAGRFILAVVLTLGGLTLAGFGVAWCVKAQDSGLISGGGSVGVKGHTKKDGTYVRPHTRKPPKK